MKDKTAAALFAFFLGWCGVHRFYLGQVGLGIFYIFLMFTGISFLLGFIDFIVFLSMDQKIFDVKYNKAYLDGTAGRYDTDFERRGRRRYGRDARREERYRNPAAERRRAYRKPPAAPKAPIRIKNPFKKSGIEKFKDFDYEGAIEDWQKALGIDTKDVSVHFNMACAYSLMENKEAAFDHLNQAVEHGFVDFEKIKTHDALAFVRIQDEFDTFVKNGYRLGNDTTSSSPIVEAPKPDLLEQLRQLGELREKGLLTDEEFAVQKKRLLG